jgi:hypothetical protein
MNTPQDVQLGYTFMKFDGCKEVVKFGKRDSIFLNSFNN